MSKTRGDVVVIGAGVFGATAALELTARGYAVTQVDRLREPHPDASSTDISKMIRMDYGSDVFYHELAEAALDGWDRWNADWPRPLYHPEGFLVLASGPMRPGGFEYESHRVLVERGYTPDRLDPSVLGARFPRWNAERYPDGYVTPRGGWAESGAVVSHLLALGREAGVVFVEDTFEALLVRESRVRGVRLRSGAEVTADTVVVAAGAWIPTLLPWLEGVLTCVAQPILHFGVDHQAGWQAPDFPPFAADIAGTGWYGFPALADGRLKLGHHAGGQQVRPDDRGSVSDQHIALARRFLSESIPDLAEAPVVGSRVCLYCDAVDGDLLIARDPDRDGLVVAGGGSGHGFKFAPVLGGLIADAVEGRAGRWSDRFRWRSQGVPAAEEARMIGRDESTSGTKP